MHEWQYIKNLILMNNFADITLLESCIMNRDILTIIQHKGLGVHILYHVDCYLDGVCQSFGSACALGDGVHQSFGSTCALGDGVSQSFASTYALGDGVRQCFGSAYALRDGVHQSFGSAYALGDGVGQCFGWDTTL